MTSLNKHFQLKIHLTVCLAQSNLASFSLFLDNVFATFYLFVTFYLFITSHLFVTFLWQSVLDLQFVTVILIYWHLLLHFTFQLHLNNVCYILLHLTFLLHSCDSLSRFYICNSNPIFFLFITSYLFVTFLWQSVNLFLHDT